METLTQQFVADSLPFRSEAGHKGSFGHLCVIAGSRGFTGAARLACEAAYRSGVGLVTLAIPRPLADIMATVLRETMTLPLPSTDGETLAFSAASPLLESIQRREALVIGPGLGRHPETTQLVRRLTAESPVPTVIDADALNALADTGPFAGFSAMDTYSGAPRILTPHPGEMARLTGLTTSVIEADRIEIARRQAARWNAVVLLKGRHTVVAHPDGRIAVNPTGNSGMATGGTGDVLSGILGALLAQGMAAYEAAAAAAWIHGTAGDRAAAVKTMRGMIAGDIIEYLPEVWRILDGVTSDQAGTPERGANRV